MRQHLVTLVLISGCGGVGDGTQRKDLALTVSPTSFSRTNDTVTVQVFATTGQTIGQGRLTFSAARGSIVGEAMVSLDSFGSASVKVRCDPADCASGTVVTADWVDGDARRMTATREVKFAGPPPTGSGLGTGTARPGDQTVGGSGRLRTDTAFRTAGVAPPAAWVDAAFNDDSWQNAQIVFPTPPELDAPAIWNGPNTKSGTTTAWFRRLFTLAGSTVTSGTFNIGVNDDAVCFINGQEVFNDADGVVTYSRGINVKSILRAGQLNVVACVARDVVLPDHALLILLEYTTE